MQKTLNLFILAAGILLVSIAPAYACRCWAGNAETTDDDRLSTAKDAINRADLVVIGQIRATSGSAEDGNIYSVFDSAEIHIEKVLQGTAGKTISLTNSAAEQVYDGRISSNILGTCAPSWQNDEINVWLLVAGEAGDFALASSCAHSLVRKWLFPEFNEINSQ